MDKTLAVFLEIVKIILPAVVVFLVGYFTLKKMLDNHYENKLLEFRQQNRQGMLAPKIQSYERLTLYLERINPSNLLNRISNPVASASDYKNLLVHTISEEYNHNLAQQLYVSPQAWQLIKYVKQEMINIVNESLAKLDTKAKGADLSKAILEELIRREEVPTDKAINFLKKEFKLIFDF